MFAAILLAQEASKVDPNVADELSKQFSEVLIPILLGTVFLVVILVGGLMLFFRRGDKEVQSRLRDARSAGVQFPGPEESFEPPAPPAPEQTSPSPPVP